MRNFIIKTKILLKTPLHFIIIILNFHNLKGNNFETKPMKINDKFFLNKPLIRVSIDQTGMFHIFYLNFVFDIPQSLHLHNLIFIPILILNHILILNLNHILILNLILILFLIHFLRSVLIYLVRCNSDGFMYYHFEWFLGLNNLTERFVL